MPGRSGPSVKAPFESVATWRSLPTTVSSDPLTGRGVSVIGSTVAAVPEMNPSGEGTGGRLVSREQPASTASATRTKYRGSKDRNEAPLGIGRARFVPQPGAEIPPSQ